MKRSVFIGIATMTAAALLAATPAHANDSGSPARLTAQQIAAMTPVAQAAYLEPLRAAADGLDYVGRTVDPATFAGVSLNGPDRKVDLYLTDVQRSGSFTAAAHGRASFDRSVIRVHRAPYSLVELKAAAGKVLAAGKSYSFAVNRIAVAVDGTGLEIGVAGLGGARLSSAEQSAAGRQVRTAAGVAVTTTYEAPAVNTSRFADSPPYYAGGYIKIRNSNGNYEGCSTGMAAHSGSHNYYFTAAHCGHTGDHVYNGNGTYEGNVISWTSTYDAALVDANSAQQEFDGTPGSYNPHPYNGAAYSHVGDYVCQDGYTSGIVCSIRVTYLAVWITHCGGNYSCTTSDVAVGHNDNGGAATQEGDSGALVFACVNGCSGRQARGLVVGFTTSGDGIWSEAPDILNAFGLSIY